MTDQYPDSCPSTALGVVGQKNDICTDLVLDAGDNTPGVTQLDSTQTLEPGYHWKAMREIGGDGQADRHFNLGETLLLVDVIDFESRVHSVKLRVHPRHGESTFIVMVDDFVNAFEPCHDSESIRQREQQGIMDRVSDIQNELMRTQMDPLLMIDAVRSEVEKEIASAEHEERRQNVSDSRLRAEREKNFDKTHRRAARRSEARGNPLAVPKATLASEVGSIITHGIDAAGVSELVRVAGRQAIIAKAQGNWLQSKINEITTTLKALTPFMTERAAVALARSSGALKLAERIKTGIESLDLYTGKGVDVFDICTGKAAPADQPLTLIQGKRFMEEEFAVWADVDETFDFQNKELFFKALTTNTQLRDQVLPTARCVVTMAVLRRTRHYENAMEGVIANMNNQLVFLLVRNGENIHVVYSATPSHEGASRLFPTRNELEKPFRGSDGSKVSILDIEFGKAAAKFEDIALCYKRFLILLCGLDHRLKLLGDFYPEHEQMSFMTASFQEDHFNFIADDEPGTLIGDSLRPFSEWMADHNKMLQSGSRVFVFSSGARTHTAELVRRSSLRATPSQFEAPFIVQKDGARFIVRVNAKDRYQTSDDVMAKCELDGNLNETNYSASMPWWLCVDAVELTDVQRYRFSRLHRSMGVGYLRLLRRLEVYLIDELAGEKEARDYLLQTAVELGGLDAGEAPQMLVTAVRNWRAARRGQALPGLDDKIHLNEILTLMVPEGRLPGDMLRMLDVYVETSGVKPLILTRTGKSKLFLYVEPTDADKTPYPNVLTWGWVKRITLEAGKTKLREVATSLLWLGTVLPASETEVSRWSGAELWMHRLEEPITLRKYARIRTLLKDAEDAWGPVLKAGKGSGFPKDLFDQLILSTNVAHAKSKARRVENVYLHVPVGVTSKDGRQLSVSYMKCISETAIYFYGDSEQRDAVEKKYVSLYRVKPQAMERLKAMEWVVSASVTELNLEHDHPGIQSACGNHSWTHREIKTCLKGKNVFQTTSKGPRWSENNVKLSFNRAFDELMGASKKSPKRIFYRAIKEELRYGSPFITKEEKSIKRKSILGKRFEVTVRAQCNGLVWSEKKSRSEANSFFTWPLISASKPAVQEHN